MKRVAWITDSTTASFKQKEITLLSQLKLLLMMCRTKIVKKVCVSAFIML